MCGIVGFTGENQAAPILLDGLSKLEYRGYDWRKKPMVGLLCRVPVESVIPDGQLMANHPKTMHIRISAMMET